MKHLRSYLITVKITKMLKYKKTLRCCNFVNNGQIDMELPPIDSAGPKYVKYGVS